MENLKARAKTFLTKVALTARAEGYEPDEDTKEIFEMVTMCYMAGAEEERQYITQWCDPHKGAPAKEGWYLVKLQWQLEDEQEPHEVPITAYWDGHEWKGDHIECYEGDDYKEPIIMAWREIAEPYEKQQDAKL